MATNVQKVGLDVSDLTKGAQTAVANYLKMNEAVKELTLTYVKYNEKGKQAEIGFKALTDAGTQFEGTIEKVSRKWRAHNEILRTNISSLREFQAAQAKVAQTAALTAAAPKVQSFVGGALGAVGGRIEGLAPALARQIQAAQRTLTTTLAQDPSINLERMFQRLKEGYNDVEIGLRGKIQSALGVILSAERKITAERQKQLNIGAQDKAQSAQQRQVTGFARGLISQFPVPTTANLDSVIRFQAALSRVVQIAQQGKIPLTDLKVLLDKIQAAPTQQIAFGTGNVAQAQLAMQKLVLEHQRLLAEQEKVPTASKKMLISLQGIFRLLQAQVLHRFFGSLINEMTSAIGTAAKLESKIGEILTISGRTGGTFEQFRGSIARLSTEFNRAPTDVAEGIYQGLSNQVINTRADVDNLGGEFLRLSRITASDVPSSVNALSSVLNAYRLPASEAANVTNQLFRAVDLGRFRLQDIGNTLGRVTVSASQLGVEFEEVLAFLTLVTRQGVPVNEAMTQLSSLMQEILEPTEQVSAIFREWGVNSGQAAIATFGFTGTIERLVQAVREGRIEMSALSNNVRGQRGIFGIAGQGVGQFREEISQFTDLEGLASRAEEAFRQIELPIGEQFQKELNKVQVILQTEVGPRILQAIQDITKPFATDLTKPFSGLSAFILRIVEAFEAIAKAAVLVVQVFTTFAGILDKLGLSFKNIVVIFGSYLLITRVAIPITQGLSAAITSLGHTAAVAERANLPFMQKYATQAQTVGSRLGTIATNLRGVFASFATAAAPFVIIGAITLLVEWLNKASAATEQFNQRLTAIQQTGERIQRQTQARLTEERAIFTGTVRAQERTALEILTLVQRRLDGLRDTQREAFRRTTNDLSEASRTVTDQMGTIISRLRQQITDSEKDIEDSFKRIQKFGDDLSNTLFQARLRAAGEAPTEIKPFKDDKERQQAQQQFEVESITRNNQLTVIRQRIGELNREALELSRRGDRESMDAARRRFDEIRTLTQQQFDLETSQERAERILQLREQGATRPGEIVRFPIDFNELQRRLGAVNEQARSFEETFQNSQRAIEANARGLLELERGRQTEITRTQQQLSQFTLLDPQGQIQERFRGQGGATRAIQEFDQLAQAARAALQPIRITEEEMDRLRARVGEHQAASIRDAVAAGNISAQQQEELRASLNERRFADLQNQLQQHTITQQAIREMERAIAAQRLQIWEQYRRELASQEVNAARERIQTRFNELREEQRLAQEAINQGNAQRTEAITTLSRQIQDIRAVAEGSGLGGFLTRTGLEARRVAGTASPQELEQLRLRSRVTELATAADEALARSQRERTPEAAAAAVTAVNSLTQAYQRFLTVAGTAAERGARIPILAAIQEASDQLPAATRNIVEAEQKLQRIQTEINSINAAIVNLQGSLIRSGVDAGELGAAMERGMAGAVQSIEGVSQSLSTLADRIEGLIRVSQGLSRIPELVGPPAPPRPFVGPPLPPSTENVFEAFAEGGLVGKTFGSRGTDDRLSWVRTGEYVVNPESTRRFYSQLVAINRGSYPRYSEGGLASSTTVGDININVDGSRNPDATARAVFGKLQREIRRRNGRI